MRLSYEFVVEILGGFGTGGSRYGLLELSHRRLVFVGTGLFQ